jgi:ParB family chromosome partitioning protein
MTDKKRGLGRGLSALLPPKQEAPEGVRSLPLAQLVPNRLQPRSRFDDTGIDELAASIRAQGMIQPIVVSPIGSNTYTIVAGERRWRAAQRAGLAVVPVVVRQVRDDRHQLELALVENVQRADLNPVEEAEAYRTLAEDFALSHDEIAQRVGKTRAAVTNTLRLLKLPPSVLDLLRAGHLSAGQARALLSLEDAAAIERLAERAARQGLSARALEALTAGRAGRRRTKVPPEPNAAAAAERLTQRLQTRVEIERRGKGGTIRIHFHVEDELIRLYELLMARAPRG